MLKTSRSALYLFVCAVLLVQSPNLGAQSNIDSNVVYGMYFGTALLMDVHYPEEPNGYGVVLIGGSGFHAPKSLDAPQLKEGAAVQSNGGALLGAGYTVFAVNHRAAPRFQYPAAVEDAQRAVRFVRHNAARYGIDPERIGAMGNSSGGHLASMLGVLDGHANAGDTTAIGQESSKVQAVVALCPPTDAIAFALGTSGAKDVLRSFLGDVLIPGASPDSPEVLLYRAASPTTYISSDDPPVLLMHGDEDSVVPFSQSVLFEGRLREAGVLVELIRVEGTGHGFRLSDGSVEFDALTPAVEWFDRHLRE